MRALLALGLAVALLAAASGCGGGSKKSASTTTAAAKTTTTASTQAAKTTPSFASAHNCGQLRSLGAQVAKSLQASSGNLQATVQNEDAVLQALAKAAPSEIRSDFQTFADAFHSYIQAIAKLKLKAGSVPTAAQIAQLTNAAKSLSTAKLQAAEQHLSAWAQKNCGG